MDVAIRGARDSDLAAIQRLNYGIFEHERQFGNTYDPTWTYGDAGTTYLRERLGNEDSIVLVAEVDRTVVGYALTHVASYPYRSVNPIAESRT